MLDTTIRRAGPFAGDGLKDLPFTFRIFEKTDVTVYKTESSESAEVQTLVQDVDYTVNMNPAQEAAPGGTVILTKALTVGEVVAVVSAVPYNQTLQLTNFSRFSPDKVMVGLDRIVAQVQQLADTLDRCIKVGEVGSESAEDLKKMLLEARDLSSKIVPYVSAINLIANDFSGTAELAFDHDYGIWGEDDTTVRMPVGGVLSTIAENAATIMPVGKNISSVVKVADNLDSIIGLAPMKKQLDELGPVATSIGQLGPAAESVLICAQNLDAIQAIGGTLGLTVEATTLPAGSSATVTKTVLSDGYKLTFGLPKGEKGDTGKQGIQGERGYPGKNGVDGKDGQRGLTGTCFTPSVSAEGVISWTNDGGLQNPSAVSIKGPQGDTGPAYSAQTLLAEFEKLIDFGTINGQSPTSFQEYITAISSVMVNLEQEAV